ncbi:MAG: hypothetical protein AAGD25_08865 [Cyanobacteria bacterium P01_F01_bin.150]
MLLNGALRFANGTLRDRNLCDRYHGKPYVQLIGRLMLAIELL